MLRLKTLGGIAVRSDERPLRGAALRRRPLALLALVAGAGPDGISRDRAMAYLWPESDTGHARNSLKQTLFAIRRDLGYSPFGPGETMLRLDTQAATVDAWEFEQAIDRGHMFEAVELYRGPFLDGFYLERNSAFERWAEAERGRLAYRYQGALEALLTRAQAARDAQSTVHWWRRLAEHDPFSSRIALGLMQALVATGERVSALQYADQHERLLRQELDVVPDTGERVFIQRLREYAAAVAAQHPSSLPEPN